MGNKSSKKTLPQDKPIKCSIPLDCCVVEINDKQKEIIDKLCIANKIKHTHIIIHAYETGTLLVCIARTYFENYLNDPVYLIGPQGDVLKTYHAVPHCQPHEYGFHGYVKRDWFHNSVQSYYKEEGHSHNPLLGITIDDKKRLDLTTSIRGRFSDTSLFLVTYGGVIYVHDIDRVIHIRWKYLDNIVKKDILPTDIVILKEAEKILSPFLVKNVINLVTEYT